MHMLTSYIHRGLPLRTAPAKNTYITFSKSLSKSLLESGDLVNCEQPYFSRDNCPRFPPKSPTHVLSIY